MSHLAAWPRERLQSRTISILLAWAALMGSLIGDSPIEVVTAMAAAAESDALKTSPPPTGVSAEEWIAIESLQRPGVVFHIDAEGHAASVSIGQITKELLEKLPSLPRLRRLSFSTTPVPLPEGMDRIGRLPELESLEIYSTPLSADIIKNWTSLAKLRELHSNECAIDDEAAKEIARFHRLKVLELRGNRLTDAGVERFATLVDLERLSLSNSSSRDSNMQLKDAGLEKLAALQKLRVLDLARTGITNHGMETLGKLPELRSVDLSDCRITGHSLHHLGRLQYLESLTLGGHQITDEAAPWINRCRGLRFLSLQWTDITDDGIARIAPLPELRRLSLSDRSGKITDAGVRQLSRFEKLDHVELRVGDLTDDSLKSMAEIGTLRRIDLSGAGQPFARDRTFTAEAFGQLAKLKHLHTLYLTNLDFGPALPALSEMPWLREVAFTMTTLGAEGEQALRAALPGTAIHGDRVLFLTREFAEIDPQEPKRPEPKPIDHPAADAPSWGKPAPDGVQLGLYLDPFRREYRPGDVVTLRLWVRNAGEKPIRLAFPWRYVLRNLGGEITILDENETRIPCDWTERKWIDPAGALNLATLQVLQPGEICRYPLLFGAVQVGGSEPPDDVSSKLDLPAKTSARLRVKLGSTTMIRGEGEPAESGTITIRTTGD